MFVSCYGPIVKLGFFSIVYSRLKMVEWPKSVADDRINRTIENSVATAVPYPYILKALRTVYNSHNYWDLGLCTWSAL
jgi:hypothetical protein